MMMSLLLAGGVALMALLVLTLISFAFDGFAPARFVRERHDLALTGFLLVPLVFALALQPRAAEPALEVAVSTPGIQQFATGLIEQATAPQIAAQSAADSSASTALTLFSQFPWAEITVAIWVLGGVIALARLISDIIGLNLMRFASRPAKLPEAITLSRKIALRTSSKTLTPLLVGYLRPVVILPAEFRFDARARPVLEHEIAHLVRGDAWTVLGLRLLMVVFWWALPLYALERLISRNRETLCDQQAAIITQSPFELAHALLDTAERIRRAPALALAATPKKSALASRIHHLASPHATQKRTTTMRLALILPLLASTAVIATPHVGAETRHDRYDYSEREDFETPLARAAAHGEIDQVRALLDAGADPDVISEDGTALMAAIYSGHTDIARELVARGANPNIVSPGDGTALITAADLGEDGVVNLLLEMGADPELGISGDGTPLIAAARHGNMRSVDLLLEAGADVNAGMGGDGTPLIGAAQSGQVEIARRLINAGADVNGYLYGDETPLINAAQQGEIEVAELLVESGADLSLTVLATDRYGEQEYRSPLSEARRMNRGDMVRWLEARGAVHNPPAE
ncbi:MAG: hypothetical protein GYB36_03565 [Alphaproteobacteria bacterium]|nr:hypothetical protein [Alphaproteobacteria bacterium]